MRRVFHFIVLAAFAGQLFAAPAPPKKPNVILVTIDTVRADHIGCYGAKQAETPTLDALARHGVLFERAISQVPLTWPSHAAILTGTYPFQNGVQDFTGQTLAPQFRSLAQAFKQSGYATGAVVSAFVLDRSWGLARGFDFYDDAFSAQTFQQKDIGLVDRKAADSVTHALNWLKRTPRRPFFLWLHLYDPHSPYDPPQPYRTAYRDHPYDGEITYADHELGRLITWLKANQLYSRTAIVVLSDHGESLGEHGEKEHGFFVYNSTVQIPLIVKPPVGSGVQPGRVDRPVETIDVAPALLHLAGVKDPALEKQFQSRGLFAADNTDAAYSETFYPFSSFGWSPLHALETSRYHYIDAPTPELYDLSSDPEEKNNIAAQQTATVAVLKDKVTALLNDRPFTPSAEAKSNLPPDAAEKLRALGYVAYRSAVSPEALKAGLADPKTKLSQFNSILAAGDAFQAGDFDKGRQLLEAVAQSDPQLYVVPFMLGEASLREQKWDDAAAQFRSSLKLNLNFDQAMTGLAHALGAAGNTTEAAVWMKKAATANPQNFRAWYELGVLESKTDPASAAADYAKALAIQPNFGLGHRDLGILQFQQKNYFAGAKELAKAVELGVNEAKVFNFLGICYSQIGFTKKGADSYRAALKLDPNLAEAHLNLGFAYQKLNRTRESLAEYQMACKLEQKFCHYVPK